jgi:hypothetical protein
MNAKFHGVTSLLLEGLTIVIGFAAVWQANKTMGVLYAILVLAAVPIILYAYCSKCEVRLTGCRHVIPGQITRLLPARENTHYGILDYVGLMLPAALLVAFPQPWLLENVLLLILFWVCLAGGLLQILLKVCKGCGNQKCLMCHLRN